MIRAVWFLHAYHPAHHCDQHKRLAVCSSRLGIENKTRFLSLHEHNLSKKDGPHLDQIEPAAGAAVEKALSLSLAFSPHCSEKVHIPSTWVG